MCDQIPDEMIMDGRRVTIEPLPIEENDSVTYVPEQPLTSTTHARGYVAHWVLVNEKLFLIEAKGCYRINTKDPVFAEWVSGTIRPPAESYGKKFAIRLENGVVLS